MWHGTGCTQPPTGGTLHKTNIRLHGQDDLDRQDIYPIYVGTDWKRKNAVRTRTEHLSTFMLARTLYLFCAFLLLSLHGGMA